MPSFLSVIALTPTGEDSFEGISLPSEHPRIYGGQVIAQALMAAYETVENRTCHSLHAYFIHPGNPAKPITFEVDRLRDGGSFTTRSVTAMQGDRVLLSFTASFQAQTQGLEHHIPAPLDTPAPEDLINDDPRGHDVGIELRSCKTPKPGLVADRHPPYHRLWCRSWQPLPEELRYHQAALAYMSDFPCIPTIAQPHPITWTMAELQTASLDHSIWFHRPITFTNWHLIDLDSPSLSNTRGFSRGTFYDRSGVPVASITQEAMLRLRTAKTSH